jgi:hypothetical protein
MIFEKFWEAKSDVGSFLLVLLVSLVIGLLATQIRWLIFERLPCRKDRLEIESLTELRIEAKLVAFVPPSTKRTAIINSSEVWLC